MDASPDMSFRALSLRQLFLILFALVSEIEIRFNQLQEENAEDPIIDPTTPIAVPPTEHQPRTLDHPPPNWHSSSGRMRSGSPHGWRMDLSMGSVDIVELINID